MDQNDWKEMRTSKGELLYHELRIDPLHLECEVFPEGVWAIRDWSATIVVQGKCSDADSAKREVRIRLFRLFMDSLKALPPELPGNLTPRPTIHLEARINGADLKIYTRENKEL